MYLESGGDEALTSRTLQRRFRGWLASGPRKLFRKLSQRAEPLALCPLPLKVCPVSPRVEPVEVLPPDIGAPGDVQTLASPSGAGKMLSKAI
jgi:hypothetical protein